MDQIDANSIYLFVHLSSFVIICLFIPHVSVRICNPRICFLKLVEEKNGRTTYTYKYVQYTCHKKNDTSTCVQREKFSLMAKRKKHEPMEQWLSQDMSAQNLWKFHKKTSCPIPSGLLKKTGYPIPSHSCACAE